MSEHLRSGYSAMTWLVALIVVSVLVNLAGFLLLACEASRFHGVGGD
jgi:hypothetical protein